jgi:hypothetical protein
LVIAIVAEDDPFETRQNAHRAKFRIGLTTGFPSKSFINFDAPLSFIQTLAALARQSDTLSKRLSSSNSPPRVV